MNIFVKIKNAIYNPKYYSEVVQKPFSYSFKYLLVFSLFCALVFAIFVSTSFMPMISLLYEKSPQLANYFPQELTITIKDGKASTNVQEPYFVKMPNSIKDNNSVSSEYGDINNLVVINTKEKFDLDKFYSYKTLSLITSDSIVYIDKQGKVSISSLSSVKDFSLNRGVVLGFIDTVRPYLFIIYPFVFLGIYFIGYIAIIGKMFYLLFGALLIWMVAKIKGMKVGYKKSYIVGMQLMTGPIIITSILAAISSKFTFIFLFSILLIISTVINLKVEKV